MEDGRRIMDSMRVRWHCDPDEMLYENMLYHRNRKDFLSLRYSVFLDVIAPGPLSFDLFNGAKMPWNVYTPRSERPMCAIHTLYKSEGVQ